MTTHTSGSSQNFVAAIFFSNCFKMWNFVLSALVIDAVYEITYAAAFDTRHIIHRDRGIAQAKRGYVKEWDNRVPFNWIYRTPCSHYNTSIHDWLASMYSSWCTS